MSTAVRYPAQLAFQGELHIARWRPLVQWLLTRLSTSSQLPMMTVLTRTRWSGSRTGFAGQDKAAVQVGGRDSA